MPQEHPTIDTEGTVISDETVETLRPEDIPSEDLPNYTVAGAIAWMQRPENDARIRQWSAAVRDKWKDMVQSIDREVAKVGNLMVDVMTDDDIAEDFKSQFLRSIIGRDDF